MKSTRAVDDFLAGLIPLQARGKELRRWAMMTGLHSVSFVEYANITIAESLQGGERTGVTVTFTKEECRDRKEH
ncbi:MAG: hypothetical protein ABJF23_08750 [Bryobacteraceae bacterium]